jgi:hypothetical protein
VRQGHQNNAPSIDKWSGTLWFEFHGIDRQAVFDEEALEQGHIRNLKGLRIRMIRVQVAGALDDFIRVFELFEVGEDKIKIFLVVGLQVEVTACRDEGSHRFQPIGIGCPVFLLSLFGPGIREKHMQIINFPGREHVLQPLGIRAECEEVIEFEFGDFLGELVDHLELPIDPDIAMIGVLFGPLHTHVSGIAADFDIEESIGWGGSLEAFPPFAFVDLGLAIAPGEALQLGRKLIQLIPVNVEGTCVLEIRF